MLELDGSFGEGGGQILRTALSLSACLKVPFRIARIRLNRKKPGLMPQHLMGVRAVAEICGADVTGAGPGSTELTFRPGEVKAGSYQFDIGTAGATSLLLQALLPPLIFSGGASGLLLTGGTHVPMSPPFDYIERVFTPALNRTGIAIKVSIQRHGFYPKGGGRILAEISPAQRTDCRKAADFTTQPEVRSVRGVSAVSNLPLSIAERQRTAAERVIAAAGFHVSIKVISVESFGAGTFIFLEPEGIDCLAGFSSIGQRGKRAETVGEEAAKAFLEYAGAHACLEAHLADQIALYLAMNGGISRFTTACVTQHLLTNLWVIEKFLGIHYAIEGRPGQPGKVVIKQ
jgi:RNA 3'-phosphate cyclase